jgi:hypothetical protein
MRLPVFETATFDWPPCRGFVIVTALKIKDVTDDFTCNRN